MGAPFSFVDALRYSIQSASSLLIVLFNFWPFGIGLSICAVGIADAMNLKRRFQKALWWFEVATLLVVPIGTLVKSMVGNEGPSITEALLSTVAVLGVILAFFLPRYRDRKRAIEAVGAFCVLVFSYVAVKQVYANGLVVPMFVGAWLPGVGSSLVLFARLWHTREEEP
jgi:hypothetical protein